MERIRGSAEISINARGAEILCQNAKKILPRGLPSKIYVAGDQRSLQSVFIIAAEGPASLARRLQTADEDWDTWHLGGFEGRPAKEVKQVIDELRLKTPWIVPIGKGKLSEHPGESFNQFKARVINRFWKLVAEIRQNPGKLIYVVTHDSVMTLLDAYLVRYGGRPNITDTNYDISTYVKENEPPGTAYWLRGTGKGPIKLSAVDPADTFPLTEAVLWRHGLTDWNTQTGDNRSSKS